MIVALVAFLVVFQEMAMKCHSHATMRAVDLHAEIKCDARGIQDAAAQKKPIFFACPLDNTSFSQWGPSQFGFADATSLFSVKAAWVEQEVVMYQCMEKVTAMAHKDGVIRLYSYSMGWFNEHVSSEGFNGLDGRFVSANAESKAKLQEACGASFKGNPPFPEKIKTETKSAQTVTVASGKIDISSLKEPVDFHFKMQPISLAQGAKIPAPYKQSADGKALVTCSQEATTLGCIRISYKQSTVESISVLAMPVKKGDSFTLLPWHEQRNPAQPDDTLTCEDTVFSKVLMVSPVIETVTDIVKEHLSSGFSQQILTWGYCALGAMIGFSVMVVYFPAVAVDWGDGTEDSEEFWYDVNKSGVPLGAVTLFAAMTVLGGVSYARREELTGKVGLVAATIGFLAGLKLWPFSGRVGDETATSSNPTRTKSD